MSKRGLPGNCPSLIQKSIPSIFNVWKQQKRIVEKHKLLKDISLEINPLKIPHSPCQSPDLKPSWLPLLHKMMSESSVGFQGSLYLVFSILISFFLILLYVYHSICSSWFVPPKSYHFYLSTLFSSLDSGSASWSCDQCSHIASAFKKVHTLGLMLCGRLGCVKSLQQ